MESSPSNNKESFIPKRKSAKKSRSAASTRIYLFSLFSYVILFATLAAVAGAFFYKYYVEVKLSDTKIALREEIDSFSIEDMNMVNEFDFRLRQVEDRVSNSVSYVSILKAVQEATIGPVRYESLSLSRNEDDNYLVTASVVTDSFDSTIFQRDIYEQNESVTEVNILGVSSDSGSDEEMQNDTNENDEDRDGDEINRVTFSAELVLPIESVPFDGTVEYFTEDLEESAESVGTQSAEIISNQ